MRSLWQFLWISGVWFALIAATLLVGIWAVTIDGARNRNATSFLFWWLFWPFIRLYFWMTGKGGAPEGRRRNSVRKSSIGMQGRDPQRFKTIREAKEYLAGIIANEAERGGAPLTEVERKMLFFTETGWTLPDMKEISSEFDRDYDQDEYERKIAAIIARIEAGWAGERQEEQTTWALALGKLSAGDHYLTVLANLAVPTQKGPRRYLKVLIAAVALLAILALDAWFGRWVQKN
jgi:hypothetical protein